MSVIGKFFAILWWIPILVWIGGERLISRWRPIPAVPPLLAREAGVTFSPLQAEALGLDSREVLRAILDDLGVRKLRLAAYWSEIEPKERGKFDFSTLDWQVEEAERRGAEVILAAGMKLPRWPECHIPQWVKEFYPFPQSQYQLSVDAVKAVAERYKDSPAIEFWQVENEPFFDFGECPHIPAYFVEQEIEVIRKADPDSKIVISDSGELGTWFRAAGLADLVGTTVYRRNWKKGIGYANYWLPAEYYEKKAKIVKKFYGDDVFIIEMQAEPWVPGPPISKYSLKEQFVGLDFKRFKEHVEYARQTRLRPVYFWGVEWWYWLRFHGHPEFWEYAKKNLFSQ